MVSLNKYRENGCHKRDTTKRPQNLATSEILAVILQLGCS